MKPIYKEDDQVESRKVDLDWTVDAIPGLLFSKTSLTAKSGKWLKISFNNTDNMPHNLVIIAPGTYDAVGQATDLMMAKPGAAVRNYIPEDAKVIAQTPMVLPGRKYDLIFQAPEQPGRYPFLCTFPGHWRLMKGELIVQPSAF